MHFLNNKLEEIYKIMDVGNIIKFKIKSLFMEMKYKIEQPKKNIPSIYLFSVPTFGNIGDLAIAEAEIKYINDNFKNYHLIEIPDYATNKAIIKVKKSIQDKDIVMIHGGGNIGNLYPKAEKDRRRIIQSFIKNPILSLPQSIYFTNNTKGEKEKKRSSILYRNAKNLTFIARDKKAEQDLKQMGAKTIITPDIVFYLNKYISKEDRKGILFILRNDNEKLINEDFINKLISKLSPNHKCKISDTQINKEFIDIEERKQVISNKLDEYLKNKVVVTDRLHGMIFAYLTRTPCLVLNNNNGKIKDTYNTWLKDIDFIRFMSDQNIHQAISSIEELLNIQVNDVDFNNKLYAPIIDWMNMIKQ